MGTNPSAFVGDDTRPVESVSWQDVQELLERFNQSANRLLRRFNKNMQPGWFFIDDRELAT